MQKAFELKRPVYRGNIPMLNSPLTDRKHTKGQLQLRARGIFKKHMAIAG